MMKKSLNYWPVFLMVLVGLAMNAQSTPQKQKASTAKQQKSSTAKKPAPTDHRLREYQQKHSDLAKRIESAEKAAKQASVDYKAQTE
ncbi:MAG: hypothetical protein GY899_13270, partial [Verrucomicrobiaceae bacterium]|nr:hypothetical protein [Verrucomicrobiaceae bacterium]